VKCALRVKCALGMKCYLPDSTIPQGLAKQADVAFCFMPGA
jgi:hypothetical protein